MGAVTQAEHQRHTILTEEDAGALRRAVAATAARLPALRNGEAELVATELATNIVRHTRAGGYVLHRPTGEGIEFLSVDRGPGAAAGVPRWAAALASTGSASLPPFSGGGLGVGLAGARRRASTFDCYSGPGGTVLLVRLGASAPATVGPWRWGGVNIPLGDASESGDAWAVAAGGYLAALVVDGLGHGPAAADAARAAVSVLERSEFERSPTTELGGFVGRAHEAMRGTRGGVLGICAIETQRDELSFAGVGNISGRVVLNGESQSLMGRNGTLGTQLQPPRTHLAGYRWGPGAVLIMVSDGVQSRWDPLAYPRLLCRDPAVIAAVLQRDYARNSDDATVLVVQDTRRSDISGQDLQSGDL